MAAYQRFAWPNQRSNRGTCPSSPALGGGGIAKSLPPARCAPAIGPAVAFADIPPGSKEGFRPGRLAPDSLAARKRKRPLCRSQEERWAEPVRFVPWTCD